MGSIGIFAKWVASWCFFICGTSSTNYQNSLQSVDSVRWGLWTPSPPFLYQNPELKCWKLFSFLSSVFLFSSQRHSRLSSCFCELFRTVHHLLVSASSSTFLSSPLTIMHLSLKSPSPSSITISESESGSMHNMTVLFFGLILTHLHGTIACFHSISMISCSVMQSMSWTSPFSGVTQHFCYIRWYSRIVFFNFKSMDITKTGYLSFGPSLDCVKFFILMIHL